MRRRSAHERVLDLIDRGGGRGLEQFRRLDHHAALTEAAHGDLFVDPRLLHRMERALRLGIGQPSLTRPAGGESFERGDLFADGVVGREHTGAHFLAVHQDGARAALREAAPELGARESQVVPKDIEQRRVVSGLDLPLGSVYGQGDGGHVGAPWRTSRDHIKVAVRAGASVLTIRCLDGAYPATLLTGESWDCADALHAEVPIRPWHHLTSRSARAAMDVTCRPVQLN